ncbi:phosphomethylpyrimidine kinase [Roseateles sp. DAIF2]|uniref:bifunctional hydroxymethylpyrimidine kinase/phosphomethylpyrimidine kinase n=1 Tax=Roseateles sp. DAIF2 TaxID=2714952 RepID=UPI0018A2649C|nr:bifunctional hydroxymethylpyrimidine kinase/phosphomethylpyrimidine kinase [Roseateles sp. DAIF2]QPF75688.1 phosphomethylpyrimidine kinase [Roseateles sp. DAIF2]
MPLLPHPSLPSPWAEAPEPETSTLPPWTQDPTPPVVWSIAGTDSGGGAGLAADIRAAAALGVHLCPVPAAITAQNSRGVAAVYPLPPEQLRAQLQALAEDLPPRVIKTGLLASVAAVELLAEALDRLRARHGRIDLVVDPVLGASAGGAAFATTELIEAYRRLLLPRCTLLTPNRREAERLLLRAGESAPALAAGLKALGAQAVCITGGDDREGPGTQDLALDWIDAPLDPAAPALGAASGWLALPRLPSAHHHGSGCSFASAAAGALARGFALPDALVLAKMAAWCAVRDGHAAGQGAGPVRATPTFVAEPAAMPLLSFGDEPLDAATLARWLGMLRGEAGAAPHAAGLYAITEKPEQVAALAASGLFAHLQLRIKGSDATALRAAIAQARAGSQGRAQLWINDHWALALEAGAEALHLGQEDWAALDGSARAELLGRSAAGRLRLGLSSHSLWELARARSLAPAYIACGPLWPTSTKAMPWLPQGLAQLAWWAHMAGRPVVGIGGLLRPNQIGAVARAGAANACLVRAADAGPESWRACATAWNEA